MRRGKKGKKDRAPREGGKELLQGPTAPWVKRNIGKKRGSGRPAKQETKQRGRKTPRTSVRGGIALGKRRKKRTRGRGWGERGGQVWGGVRRVTGKKKKRRLGAWGIEV